MIGSKRGAVAPYASPKEYSTTQKVLHWAAAFLLMAQWWTSRAVLRTHEIHQFGRKIDPFDLLLHRLHVYGGMVIFALVIWRLALRYRAGALPLPVSVPRWAATSARAAHVLSYALLIGLTLTGLVTTYLWFGMAVAHRALVYGLYAFVALHVAAVVWHDGFHQASLMRRMAFRRQNAKEFDCEPGVADG